MMLIVESVLYFLVPLGLVAYQVNQKHAGILTEVQAALQSVVDKQSQRRWPWEISVDEQTQFLNEKIEKEALIERAKLNYMWSSASLYLLGVIALILFVTSIYCARKFLAKSIRKTSTSIARRVSQAFHREEKAITVATPVDDLLCQRLENVERELSSACNLANIVNELQSSVDSLLIQHYDSAAHVPALPMAPLMTLPDHSDDFETIDAIPLRNSKYFSYEAEERG